METSDTGRDIPTWLVGVLCRTVALETTAAAMEVAAVMETVGLLIATVGCVMDWGGLPGTECPNL